MKFLWIVLVVIFFMPYSNRGGDPALSLVSAAGKFLFDHNSKGDGLFDALITSVTSSSTIIILAGAFLGLVQIGILLSLQYGLSMPRHIVILNLIAMYLYRALEKYKEHTSQHTMVWSSYMFILKDTNWVFLFLGIFDFLRVHCSPINSFYQHFTDRTKFNTSRYSGIAGTVFKIFSMLILLQVTGEFIATAQMSYLAPVPLIALETIVILVHKHKKLSKTNMFVFYMGHSGYVYASMIFLRARAHDEVFTNISHTILVLYGLIAIVRLIKHEYEDDTISKFEGSNPEYIHRALSKIFGNFWIAIAIFWSRSIEVSPFTQAICDFEWVALVIHNIMWPFWKEKRETFGNWIIAIMFICFGVMLSLGSIQFSVYFLVSTISVTTLRVFPHKKMRSILPFLPMILTVIATR